MTENSPIRLSELQAMAQEALAGDAQITFYPNAPGQDASPDIYRLYFAARCTCGVAAMMTIEVSRAKTVEEVRRMFPNLLAHLRQRAALFRAMPCERHAAMGPRVSNPPKAGPQTHNLES